MAPGEQGVERRGQRRRAGRHDGAQRGMAAEGAAASVSRTPTTGAPSAHGGVEQQAGALQPPRAAAVVDGDQHDRRLRAAGHEVAVQQDLEVAVRRGAVRALLELQAQLAGRHAVGAAAGGDRQRGRRASTAAAGPDGARPCARAGRAGAPRTAPASRPCGAMLLAERRAGEDRGGEGDRCGTTSGRAGRRLQHELGLALRRRRRARCVIERGAGAGVARRLQGERRGARAAVVRDAEGDAARRAARGRPRARRAPRRRRAGAARRSAVLQQLGDGHRRRAGSCRSPRRRRGRRRGRGQDRRRGGLGDRGRAPRVGRRASARRRSSPAISQGGPSRSSG